jgi:UDPglucose 6-dehydrogenase
MKVTITGTGYVGLVTGACLAEMGNDVLCLDIDAAKVRVLNEGGLPIHEPGLAQLVAGNVRAGRLAFTTDADRAVAHGMLQFIAVGTPPDEDGSADLSHVLAAARAIGQRMTEYKVIVDKSTVPVGTADRVAEAIRQEIARRQADVRFSMVSNPEFLKEGAAVEDFMRPDRVVIGTDDEQAIELMRSLYAPYLRNHDRLLVMDLRSAELTKYAANAMLATRISFMNEMANLAERLGADIEAVRKGIGSDSRIGYSFLYAGCGYGGSCFPKDVKALVKTGEEQGEALPILRAVEAVNAAQKKSLAARIVKRFGADLSGRRFAVWGLAFKPNTDDMREAPSRTLIDELLARGAQVSAYDPIAIDAARALYVDTSGVAFAPSALEACEGADALAIVTEWRQFRSPDFTMLKAKLKHGVIFDGRNLYDPRLVASNGLEYVAIGRSAAGEASRLGA